MGIAGGAVLRPGRQLTWQTRQTEHNDPVQRFAGWPEPWESTTGPLDADELETALNLLTQVSSTLVAAATNKEVNQRPYPGQRRRLKALLDRAEIRMPFVWKEVEQWVAHAKMDFRTYSERREHIKTLTDGVRVKLEQLVELERADVGDDLDELAELAEDVLDDSSAMRAELRRVRDLLREDPVEAIGRAKKCVESTAKAVLVAQGEPVISHSFDKLTNAAMRALGLDPVANGSSPEAQAMRLVKELASSVNSMRNLVGYGHGAHTEFTDVELRHARLAPSLPP